MKDKMTYATFSPVRVTITTDIENRTIRLNISNAYLELSYDYENEIWHGDEEYCGTSAKSCLELIIGFLCSYDISFTTEMNTSLIAAISNIERPS
jgi:hypothetical protein